MPHGQDLIHQGAMYPPPEYSAGDRPPRPDSIELSHRHYPDGILPDPNIYRFVFFMGIFNSFRPSGEERNSQSTTQTKDRLKKLI